IPIREYFYDEDGELVRVISFHDVKKLGDRLLPVRMQVVPQGEPDEYTEIVYRSIEFDVPIEQGFFSLANLRRR
ncbi:MAG TPA: outer membrane lipoprotein-sorting protein, partial [Gammaproteobacteria bacterium]|nr:outer membrane lipoprotein-sorting protein [Gammaproteobacteria bacterium]